jgi:hypothetical protein
VPTANKVFLFDVDNTLLDHDQVTADLRRHLESEVGAECSLRYWEIFETLRAELGYADYLGALQRYRIEHARDPHLPAVSYFLMRYPFEERLFPDAVALVEGVRRWGRSAILSDGDVVFQPHKMLRSGLFDAFDGNVMICVHKELESVAQRYPARHYVVVDDKLRITVFVRQGHYALDPHALAEYAEADLGFTRIGNLLDYDFDRVPPRTMPARAPHSANCSRRS